MAFLPIAPLSLSSSFSARRARSVDPIRKSVAVKSSESTRRLAMVVKGDKIPTDAGLMQLTSDNKPGPVTPMSIFGGKKVALITVPGALTGTCKNSMLREWVAAEEEIKEKGIDEIVCLAVNDCFVMKEFEQAVDAEGKITFVADGAADFTKQVGLELDTGNFGGIRAIRASFIVDDGVFTQCNLENGSAYDGPSKPDTMLDQL